MFASAFTAVLLSSEIFYEALSVIVCFGVLYFSHLVPAYNQHKLFSRYLGAVKLNKVFPWERDADITFLTANYSAFKALGPIFRAAGYSFSAYEDALWCCVDNRQAGGKFRMSADGWSIQLYGQHLMESEILVANGEAPTKVDFAGQMVTVMRNPGLFARNCYGKNIYKHQEHWLDLGKKSGWEFYHPSKFKKCPKQGHSGCLSQYSVDGNMQFGRDMCPCTLESLPWREYTMLLQQST